MPDNYLTGYFDEARARGVQAAPSYGDTSYQPVQNTYTNGHHYAGTNIPMSDAAYALLSNNGTRPIATDRDVTGTGGVGRSLTSAANFEADHIGNIFEGLRDEPGRLVFGFDPIGTEIGNAVTGSNYDPLVNQMGGATSRQIGDYEAIHGTNSAGGAQGLHNAAAGTAGVIAAGTLANGGLTGGQGGATVPYRGTYEGNFVSNAGNPATNILGNAGNAGLPEVVVNGVRGAGLTAGQQGLIGAGIGAGAAGLGSALSSPGAAPTNYGSSGGWQANSNPVGNTTFGNNADVLANSGSVGGGAGANSGTGVLGQVTGGAMGGNTSLWGDLASGALSAFNSYQQGQGAKDAANAQIKGDAAAIAEQRRQFDLIMGMLEPQRQLGVNAIGTLNSINGYNTGPEGTRGAPNMGAFYTSPDYQFKRDEGLRDTQNLFAFRGGAQSGNAQRGIAEFNSNLASGEFNNFYQRRLQEAGLGGAATSQAVNNAQYTGGNVSNLLSNQGNARASGIINSTNAVTSGINDVSGLYGNWLRNRQLRVA